jgi:hypothetical protein
MATSCATNVNAASSGGYRFVNAALLAEPRSAAKERQTADPQGHERSDRPHRGEEQLATDERRDGNDGEQRTDDKGHDGEAETLDERASLGRWRTWRGLAAHDPT